MNEDLLKRADQVIRENQIIRARCRGNLVQARAASTRIKKTLQWARADTAKARQLGLETADNAMAALEHCNAKTASGSSGKT